MNPYSTLDERAFWSPAVARRNMFDIDQLWRPKFDITPATKTATFGSCFAQHFGKAMKARAFSWFDAEPQPPGLTESEAKAFNYGVFTARTGNIYTTSLLLQWTRWALGKATPPDEVWEKDGRFYDPFRPVIEPDGFASVQEMRNARQMCLEAFARAILSGDMFVFTLGLTESWWASDAAYEYPMCPGTSGGVFDPDRHHFVNQDYETIKGNLEAAIALMREANPGLVFLLTVSPVPLTATCSGNHVLVATMESKSILRAVAGSVARTCEVVDYFPSYEIINSAPFRGTFFEANLRGVNHSGVSHVMKTFFDGLAAVAEPTPVPAPVPAPETTPASAIGTAAPRGTRAAAPRSDADLVCEEEILDAFGPKG